jgi:chemotaxis methyl-accepting protein methylase
MTVPWDPVLLRYSPNGKKLVVNMLIGDIVSIDASRSVIEATVRGEYQSKGFESWRDLQIDRSGRYFAYWAGGQVFLWEFDKLPKGNVK